MKSLEVGKSARIDDIRNEILEKLGGIAKIWLLDIFNLSSKHTKLLTIWSQATVILILKSDEGAEVSKTTARASSYANMNLYERLLTHELTIEKILIKEQVVFWPANYVLGKL